MEIPRLAKHHPQSETHLSQEHDAKLQGTGHLVLPAAVLLLAGFPLLVVIHDFGNRLLLADPPGFFRSIWPVLDSPVHALLAAIIVSPFLLRLNASRKEILTGWVLAVFFAVMIDVDHAVTARSFSIAAVTNLARRPVTHSFVPVVIFSLLVSAVFRSKTIGGMVLLGLLSHLFRDAATGGVPLLWPFRRWEIQMTDAACYLGLFGLYGVAMAYAFRRRWHESLSQVVDLSQAYESLLLRLGSALEKMRNAIADLG